MDDADTLTITPNYPGRLIAVALLGIAAGMSGLMLFGLTHTDIWGPGSSTGRCSSR